MSKHLPECLHDDDTYGLRGLCICDELRACEQRVLDAAREAVAALLVDEDGWDQHDEWMNDALAAIDALREEQAPPPLPPSVGVPSKPMWPLREEQK